MERDLSANIFEKDITFLFPDADYMGRIKLSALFRAFADIAGDHYIARNLDYDFLRENDYVFLMSRLALKIHKYPESKKKYKISTWECGLKGATFMRVSEMRDESGNLLCESEAGWVCMSVSEHRILRPNDFKFLCGQLDKQSSVHIGRINMKEENFCREYTPRLTDIDMNGHVYNGVYGDIVQNSLSKEDFEKGFSEVKINYMNEITLGENVSVFTESSDNGIIVRGRNENTVCFEFEGMYR